MESITIQPGRLTEDDRRLEVEIWVGGEKCELYYLSDEVKLQPCAEALISATLLAAMKQRIGVIEIDLPVSPEFLAGIDQIQDVFQSWKPSYGRVEIRHAGLQHADPVEKQTGVFFSAGVDSYYAFLSRRDQINALIYLDGFDIPLEDQAMRRRMRENLTEISRRFDIPIYIIETNVRQFQEKFANWGFSHGSAIASVGHLLAGEFSHLFLASGGSPDPNRRYGVHSELDPQWSSPRVRFEHDTNIDRIQKSRFISQFEPVHDTLRVCLRSPAHGLNCGYCEKCLRSMVYLQVTGDYEKYTVFERPLELNRLAKYKRIGASDKDLLYPALTMLEAENNYPDTAKALRKILYPPSLVKKLIVQGRKIRKKLSL